MKNPKKDKWKPLFPGAPSRVAFERMSESNARFLARLTFKGATYETLCNRTRYGGGRKARRAERRLKKGLYRTSYPTPKFPPVAQEIQVVVPAYRKTETVAWVAKKPTRFDRVMCDIRDAGLVIESFRFGMYEAFMSEVDAMIMASGRPVDLPVLMPNVALTIRVRNESRALIAPGTLVRFRFSGFETRSA